MIQSNYKITASEDPTEAIKKKLLAKPVIEDDMPTTSELDHEIEGNRPARTKEEMDRLKDNQDKKDGQIYGGSYEAASSAAGTAGKLLESGKDTGESKGNWGTGSTGSKVAGAAGGALGMATTVMGQKGPMTKRERKANTMSLTAQGAAAGSAFGPWGTLIGAGVGLGTGLIQGIGDQKELDAKAKMERITEINNAKDSRERAQRISDGKKVLDAKKNILSSQMGMVGSKYTQTKTS